MYNGALPVMCSGIRTKITNFSGSIPVRRLLCSNTKRKFVQTSFAQKLQFIGYIFVADS